MNSEQIVSAQNEPYRKANVTEEGLKAIKDFHKRIPLEIPLTALGYKRGGMTRAPNENDFQEVRDYAEELSKMGLDVKVSDVAESSEAVLEFTRDPLQADKWEAMLEERQNADVVEEPEDREAWMEESIRMQGSSYGYPQQAIEAAVGHHVSPERAEEWTEDDGIIKSVDFAKEYQGKYPDVTRQRVLNLIPYDFPDTREGHREAINRANTRHRALETIADEFGVDFTEDYIGLEDIK